MLNFSRVLKNLNKVSSLDLTDDWHILRMGHLVVASKVEKNDGTYVSIYEKTMAGSAYFVVLMNLLVLI